MITIRLFSEGKLQQGGLELLEQPGPKWIDVEGPTAEALAPLAAKFGLHPLGVEDCLHLDQRPKLEEYPGHLFMVLHGFSRNGDVTELQLHELHFFVGPDWLITVHELATEACASAARRFAADVPATIGRGVDFAAYVIADALVDTNFPLLDSLNDELEDLETQIFELPSPKQLQRIFALKRALVTLRRVLSPQRDVVALLSRRGTPLIQDRTTLYFRDIYDHLVRLYEQIDAARDLLTGSMEGYLSVVANRTNDITKQLTIFATLFLPLSFITGFFGQNFDVIQTRTYFWIMLALVAAVPIGLVWWFRRKDWF